MSTQFQVEDDGSALAEALVAFERRLTDESPESIVVCDDSEASLAATLVALKMGIGVESLPAARESGSDNARLIEQLTSYT